MVKSMKKTNDPVLKENLEIIKELKENLVEIKTSIGTDNNLDLRFLDEYIKDKYIIGLGEATHGTKEFQDVRTRIISYLVENLGFRAIVLEESFGYCLRLNSYILNGGGTVEEAVNEGLCFPWVFKTEETLELVKWLREYNIKANERDKVRFYGMDVQGPEKVLEAIDLYVKKVDFKNYDRIKAYLNLCEIKVNNDNSEILKRNVNEIRTLFIENKISYIEKSIEREFSEIYQCIEVYDQWIEYGEEKPFNIRDKAMYENTKWVIENEGKYNEGKVIVIAHNDHIAKDIFLNSQDEVQMGYLLEKEYKDKYYTICTEFSRGLFYSWNIETRELKVYEVNNSVEQDLAARIFEATDVPMFYLDFKNSSSKSLNLEKFLSNVNIYRTLGAVYDEKDNDWGLTEMILGHAHDAILYIRDTKNTTVFNKNA